MTRIFTLVLLLLSVGSYAQNSGQIQGTITTSDGKPAEFISVVIKGTERGTTTNEKGQFTIKGVKPGAQTLITKAVGIANTETAVTVKAGINRLDIVINTSHQHLQEVTVTGERTNKFRNKRSESVARLPLNNLENAQVYTTINQQLLKEQVITNFSDALKNSPGLDKLWTSTGRPGDGAAYYSLRGFTIQASMVNGIAGLTNGDIDPAAVEKIEVIKGPSGTLFGGALVNFGGLINISTKRATIDTLGGEVSYTTGSYGMNRLTADVYTPVNTAKNVLFRLNASYQDQNSWQDAGFRRSVFVAPSLRYLINEKATVDFGAEFYNAEGTNPLMVFLNRTRSLFARTPDELSFDWNRSYTNNDVTVKTPNTNVHGHLNYKINDNWTAQTNVGQSFRKSDGYYQYVMYRQVTADDSLIRFAAYQNSFSTSLNVQQNFVGDFHIGELRNRLVVGVDYLNQYTNNSSSVYINFDTLYARTGKAFGKYANISRDAIASKLNSGAGGTKGNTESHTYSAYISNVLNITNNLSAMLSVRVERFNNKGSYNNYNGLTTGAFLQTMWSPKFGIVYQPIKDKIAIFGNYMNGFKNVAPGNQLIDGNIILAAYKPQYANQLEGGVKFDLFQNKIGLTASYYDISVTNTLRGETFNNVNYNVQDGTQNSKGFEVDLTANPLSGLNVIFGYSHNDSKITKAAPATEGRRPNSAGPEDLVNFWASYTFSEGKVKGLGIGFGGNYASENIITNTVTTGQFTLPSYTVLNGTVFYNFNKFRVGLKADNLSNERYFKGWSTVEPQQPRSFLANFVVKL